MQINPLEQITDKTRAEELLRAGYLLRDEDACVWGWRDGAPFPAEDVEYARHASFYWGGATDGPFTVVKLPYHETDNSIAAWCQRSHDLATEKGFNDGVEVNYAELSSRLMLAVGECAEAQEALRVNTDPQHRYLRADGKPEGFGPELADVFLRLAHIAKWAGVDLQYEVNEKHKFNCTREHKHGKVF
jgi:NTP pyrophosphatase (non-canonical NTP hydrolase)